MPMTRMLIPPLIGAVIGYVTNYIAIKMLFRPLTPKYLFGVRLPFTPGIVPRNQRRLADALGKAVFAKFFNWDDLEVVFLSDAFVEEVTDRLTRALRSETTIGEALGNPPEETAEAIQTALCARIAQRMTDSGMVREMVLKGAAALSESGESGGAGKPLLASFAEAYAGPIAEKLEAYLREHGTELLLPAIQAEGAAAAETALGTFTADLFGEDDAALRAGIRDVYLRFMRENVRPIVESIDIVTQITAKMNQMSPGEVESLVLDVVARELRLVVWFGALLGAVIGTVNLLF